MLPLARGCLLNVSPLGLQQECSCAPAPPFFPGRFALLPEQSGSDNLVSPFLRAALQWQVDSPVSAPHTRYSAFQEVWSNFEGFACSPVLVQSLLEGHHLRRETPGSMSGAERREPVSFPACLTMRLSSELFDNLGLAPSNTSPRLLSQLQREVRACSTVQDQQHRPGAQKPIGFPRSP